MEWAVLAKRVGGLLTAWGLVSVPGVATVCGVGLIVVGVLPRGLARGRKGNRSGAQTEARPLRWWIVVLVALGILAMTVLALLWLMGLAAQAQPQDVPKARIDAVRTAMTLGAGLVGMSVLVLTGRKQWLAERTQRHTERDAAEQRVTELYTAAAQQLASENAPVRMAGLYALSRLGQNNLDHRQTIVNLFCAYLRMPYTPPDVEDASSQQDGQARRLGLRSPDRARQGASPLATALALVPTLAAASSQLTDDDYQRQELQVRLTAQRLLAHHLRPDPDKSGRVREEFWEDMDLDLEGATLYRWNMAGCRVRRGDFTHVEFHGETVFNGAVFHGLGWFGGVVFHGETGFNGAVFHGRAGFNGAVFHSMGRFDGAVFHSLGWFEEAVFHGLGWFDGAVFHHWAGFNEVVFHGKTGFNGAVFHGLNWFAGAVFHDRAGFDGAVFHGLGWFGRAVFHHWAGFNGAVFHHWAGFDGVWLRLDHNGGVKSTAPAGWSIRERDPGGAREGHWGELVLDEEAGS
ncbi:pentapeptide repeat-containing protein [Actinopolyspora halophila]|uniref:pentapeptide repeat-containing protein n=1 Tax=Actinopolyspora halophila TaxID=1850 RepID=UPI00036D05EA|nr:pentapeptide repeat-containing protein [Actinopolyspora halophila]